MCCRCQHKGNEKRGLRPVASGQTGPRITTKICCCLRTIFLRSTTLAPLAPLCSQHPLPSTSASFHRNQRSMTNQDSNIKRSRAVAAAAPTVEKDHDDGAHQGSGNSSSSFAPRRTDRPTASPAAPASSNEDTDTDAATAGSSATSSRSPRKPADDHDDRDCRRAGANRQDGGDDHHEDDDNITDRPLLRKRERGSPATTAAAKTTVLEDGADAASLHARIPSESAFSPREREWHYLSLVADELIFYSTSVMTI